MKIITCLYVERKIAHEGYVISAWCAHGGTLWWENKGVVGEDFLLAWNEEDIKHYVYTCIKCQSIKLVHKKKFMLYKPLPIPSSSFENVSMDFMTCFSEWEGMDAIFVVVDRFSKMIKFALTQINTMVMGTAKLFFDMLVQNKGLSKVIINDYNMKFTLEFWTLM